MRHNSQTPNNLRTRCVGTIRLAAALAYSAVALSVAIFFAVLRPFGFGYYPFARHWAKAVLRIAGARLETVGFDRLNGNANYVFFANHASHLDPLAIMAALDHWETRWVAKKELESVPIFGYGLKVSGQLLIDRNDREQAVATIRQALGNERVSVVFFPEGARSGDGQLRDFKKGGAAFAIEAGLSVVPVAISGTDRILPKHGNYVVAGTIRLTCGEPIDVAGMTDADRDELTQVARVQIERLLQEF